MKSNLILVVSLALVVIIAGASGCVWAPSPESGSTGALPNTGIIFSQQNTGIWVSGEGKVNVVPDIAILHLGVEAQAATVAEAKQRAAGAMNAVMGELDDHGIASKDIQTQYCNIYPVKRWKNDEEILIGYRVSNMVTAKIRKVDNTGVIIDAVARAGGDYIRINSISFTVDDLSVYNEEAREKAMADAKAKAEQLADLADVKLGKPIYINESGGYAPIPYPARIEAISAPAPTTPISPGETEVSLTVQVVYSIK